MTRQTKEEIAEKLRETHINNQKREQEFAALAKQFILITDRLQTTKKHSAKIKNQDQIIPGLLTPQPHDTFGR